MKEWEILSIFICIAFIGGFGVGLSVSDANLRSLFNLKGKNNRTLS